MVVVERMRSWRQCWVNTRGCETPCKRVHETREGACEGTCHAFFRVIIPLTLLKPLNLLLSLLLSLLLEREALEAAIQPHHVVHEGMLALQGGRLVAEDRVEYGPLDRAVDDGGDGAAG